MILTPRPLNSATVQADIVLTTLVSSYAHSAFGLRYLMANLGDLESRAIIAEFTIQQNPRIIVEDILKLRPQIVGFGVYIWNARQTLDVVATLKKVSPETVVILGGPEVTYETEDQEICRIADLTIKGEADTAFAEVCRNILESSPQDPVSRTQTLEVRELPDVNTMASPYRLYSQHDVENRVVYVEASRGCPYKCEYCLSALDKSVRNFPLESFLKDMTDLIERGARRFKFIDRTFNLSIKISTRILEFFLGHSDKGLFLHFEMVPDRLPDELRSVISQFPPGSLQFEIGIQTWNQEVATRVSRRQDYAKIRENFEFLTTRTHVHLHADLIAGLPGESLESFARGFDEVMTLNSPEIQLGMLKRLRGAPIARHESRWGMAYQSEPPYTVLKTSVMSFEEVQKMSRLARFWELIANSGNFQSTLKMFFAEARARGSIFWTFWKASEFLERRFPEAHSISLPRLSEGFFDFLVEELRLAPEAAALCLGRDYMIDGRKDPPEFLRKRGLWPGSVKSPDRMQMGSNERADSGTHRDPLDTSKERGSLLKSYVNQPNVTQVLLPRQRRRQGSAEVGGSVFLNPPVNNPPREI